MKLLLATAENCDCPLLVSNTRVNMHIQIQEQYAVFIIYRMLIVWMKYFTSHAMVTDQIVKTAKGFHHKQIAIYGNICNNASQWYSYLWRKMFILTVHIFV